jgi:hypothetical protein
LENLDELDSFENEDIVNATGTIPDTESWPQLTNMCELAFIEYNPTFDSIMPFPCFFDVTRKT